MAQSLTPTRFAHNVASALACPVTDGSHSVATALRACCRAPEPTEVLKPRAASGGDDFEIRVTLRVNSAHLEDVVAHSFANPHCVDIQVQPLTLVQRSVEEGHGLRLDDQVPRGVRSNGRSRWEAGTSILVSAPVPNEWDEV